MKQNFFPILLSALAASVPENILIERGVIRAGEGTNGTGQGVYSRINLHKK